MNFAPYIPLAGFICNVFFALFVFSRSPRATANRVYLLLGMSIATWNLGCYFLFVVDTAEAALVWARVVHFGVIFAIAAFVHLSMIAVGTPGGRAIRALYIFQIFLALLDLTPWFIESARHRGAAGWYARAGPAYYLLAVPYSLSFASVFYMGMKRKLLPIMQRRRLTPLMFAQVTLTVLGLNDILPIIDVENYPGTNIQVYPYGSLAAVFFGITVAYSVLQHQLLDVQIGLSRIVAHLIRFAFLFFIAAALLLTVWVFTQEFTVSWFVSSLCVFMASAIIASMLFPRVFGGVGLDKWERRILGDRFEYQDQVHSFIERMTWYSDMSALLDDVHGMLTMTFRLKGYKIILRDETNRVFTLVRAHPEQPQRQYSELRLPSPVFEYFEHAKGEYLTLVPGVLHRPDTVLERQAREQMRGIQGLFCFGLVTQGELFGLFLVGEKSSGEPYTATDLNLLSALVKNISVMINQIRLKTQILHAEEQDLLGRMSRGMAHDLNNLLTPIWTFLQLSNEGLPREALEELLPVALRNVKGMQAYIREALFFSEHLRPDFQLGRLDVLIAQAAEIARNSRAKDVEIVTTSPGEVLAEMDEVLMQRLVANLIANAIDASPEGGKVEVDLERLVKTEASRDWLRVCVVDRGVGIKKENLERVFTPYFTTKDRGDESRGFGLGLAICRKIINLHGGNLSIASRLKKGTTVQVDLPSRQVKSPVAAVASTN